MGVAREQEGVWVKAKAGWVVHELALALVETVFVPVAVLWYRTK